MLIHDNFYDGHKEQLDILENSEVLLKIIIIGSLIRLIYLREQKYQLINSKLCVIRNKYNNSNGFCMQLISSLLVLYGLFGFYDQSKNISKSSTASEEQRVEVCLSEIVIAVSLIRLYILFLSNDNSDVSVNN